MSISSLEADFAKGLVDCYGNPVNESKLQLSDKEGKDLSKKKDIVTT